MNLKTILTLAVVCVASSAAVAQTYSGTLSCGQSLIAPERPGFDSPAELTVKNGAAQMKRGSDKFEESLAGRVAGQKLSLEGQGRMFAGGQPWTTKLQGSIDGKTFKGKGELLINNGERYRECQVLLVNTAKPIEQVAQAPATVPVAQKPVADSPVIASFDCQKATSKTEKMICSNPQTAKLDVALSNAYRKALAASDNVNDLKSEQMAWLSSVRNKCESSECLDREYAVRIKALEVAGTTSSTNAPAVVPTPPEPQATIAAPTIEEPKQTAQEAVVVAPKVEVPVVEATPTQKPATVSMSSETKKDLAMYAIIALSVLLTGIVVGYGIYWFRTKYPKIRAKELANREASKASKTSTISSKTNTPASNPIGAALKPENRTVAASVPAQVYAAAKVSNELDATYQVKISGYKSGEDPRVVRQRLEALLKATPAQVNSLLSMPEYILKKALTEKQAQTYQAAIFKAGANCVIEEESSVVRLEVDLPSSVQDQAQVTQTPHAVQQAVVKTSEKPQNLSKNLFEGDVALLLSKLNVKQGDAVITLEKLTYSGGDKLETVFKADIQSVVETKHGLGKKVVLTLNNGETVSFLPVNHKGFLEAMQVLTGERDVGQLTPAPNLSEVKNWSAWLAAFGPLIASNLIVLIWGQPPYWGWMKTLIMMFNLIVATFIFLRIDAQVLQKQGYSFGELKLDQPQSPTYLFTRAKVFGHNPAYAIVWCVALITAIYYFVM